MAPVGRSVACALAMVASALLIISMKMNDEMSFICLVALLFVMYARKCNFGNSESLLDKKICHPEPPLAKDLRRCFDRESPRQAFQRIVVGKPREADQVPNIPGGPSPKIGAQDDSCLYTSFIPYSFIPATANFRYVEPAVFHPGCAPLPSIR